MKINSILLLVIVIAGLTFFRAFRLLNQSPFIDEAIYADHIQTISRNPNVTTIFAPAKNGLSPLFIYFASFLNIFLKNPFLSGRLLSLILMFFSTIVLFLYLKIIKSPNVSLGVTFFAFNPFLMVYSQMVMLETMLILSGLCFLFMTEVAIRQNNNFSLVILSLNFVLLVASKYIGIFLLPYLIIRIIQTKQFNKLIIFIVCLLFLLIIISPFILPITKRLPEMMQILSTQNTPTTLRNQVSYNIRLVYIWLRDYYSLPVLILLAISLIPNYKNKWFLALFISLFLNFIFFIFFTHSFFPRYLILSTIIFSVFIAFLSIKDLLKTFVFALIVLIYIPSDLNIMSNNLSKAKIAKEDIFQYDSDWTAGKKVMEVLKKAQENEIICIKEFDFYFEPVRSSFFPYKYIKFIKSTQTCPHGLKFISPR